MARDSFRNATFIALFALALAACGGGGGGGAGSTPTPPNPPPPPPAPTITLTANPGVVRTGATSQITWSTTNATTCEGRNGWSGARATFGTEMVGPLTQSTTFSLICNGGGGSQSADTAVAFRPGVNSPPTAEAGNNQTVFSTATVELSGLAFSSDDAGLASFAWTQIAGPPVSLTEFSPGQIRFVAPLVAVDTVLTISLVVTDDEGLSSAPDTVNVTVQPIPPAVTLHGQVSFELVPTRPFGGLNYSAMGFLPLEAEILVEALDATTFAVLASGRFARDYSLIVPSQRDIVLRAVADSTRLAPRPPPHWQITVRDLGSTGTPTGPVYSFTTAAFNSGPGGMRDLNIPSGWNTLAQPIGTRHAAPFAVLNAVQSGLNRFRFAQPAVSFPPLTIDWSPNNPGGQTFFTIDPSGARIVLSGEVNVDTDEYDSDVVLHEFGHFVDFALSRSDSIGGTHAFGDLLDMRVAFGEGLATAFACFAGNSPLMRDSFGPNQSSSGFIDIESDFVSTEGWYAETSVQEVLWDLFDNVNDGGDSLTMGFEPLLAIWRGPHRTTDAFTSVFTFMTAFKQARPADAIAISNLLAAEGMNGAAIDDYGNTETNDAFSSEVLPVYTPLALGASVQLRSTDAFGTPNKLSSHRFVRFSLPATTNVRFDLTAAAGRDADIRIFRQGVSLGPQMGPANETFTVTLSAGDYVFDVYDCGNAGCNSGVPPAPTDMTLTLTPN